MNAYRQFLPLDRGQFPRPALTGRLLLHVCIRPASKSHCCHNEQHTHFPAIPLVHVKLLRSSQTNHKVLRRWLCRHCEQGSKDGKPRSQRPPTDGISLWRFVDGTPTSPRTIKTATASRSSKAFIDNCKN